ncbi:MAG: DUF4873 domain-containing protein [Oryzihumus sp.]
MPPPDQPDEGYDGPATLHAGDTRLDVRVTLRGAFQPIDGRYHWHGRVAASAEVDATVASGASVVLQTPTGRAAGRLSDVDPWGRYRVTGTGRPPFAVATDEG